MIETLIVFASALNMDNFWTFLWEGDFLGFFQAIYVSSFGVVDLMYGSFGLLFLGAIYIRSQSLVLVSILWILLGSFYIAMMPVVSGLAILFIVLGIAGLLYRTFTRSDM